jgi:site-specific DNA-methyltransferase (adenine-specific)
MKRFAFVLALVMVLSVVSIAGAESTLPYEPGTVLRADKPTNAALHPTVKPQALLVPLIRNSSKKGWNVLDLFGGSGSTLIACEQTGRTCYMMELDPHYVDVIIARWEEFTGQRAELINGE